MVPWKLTGMGDSNSNAENSYTFTVWGANLMDSFHGLGSRISKADCI